MIKNMKYAVLIVSLFLLACNSHRESNKTINPVPNRVGYLSPNNIKINGRLKFEDSYKNALTYFGKPDSIIKPNYNEISNSYQDKEFKYCYYNGLKFEKYRDTLILRGIKFNSSKVYLTCNNMIFNSSTSLTEINTKMPGVILDTLGGTDMDKYIVVTANTSKAEVNGNDKWILTFDYKSEKLIEIDYWIDD